MRRALALAVLAVAAAVTLVPFLYMLAVSMAAQGPINAGTLLPAPSLAAMARNYGEALTTVPLPRYMANGAFVCAAILVAQVTVAAPAGYALAKLPFRGRPSLLGGVVPALMIPMQVPAIPLSVAVACAGLLDTYTALIAPFLISAFAIFLFRRFFMKYPDRVLDDARLDGFSKSGIVWRLMVPAAWPAVAAFATISVINHWSDLYWPLVVVTDSRMMTPPLGLASFRASGEQSGDVDALMAGGVIVTAPLVVAFVFLQRTLIRGLGLGARTRPRRPGSRPMHRRTFSLTLATAAIAAPALAQETTISVFHAWPSHAEWQQGLADRFMETHPAIRIEVQAPSTDYDEGLVTVIRQELAGAAPDVFMVGSHLLAELVARDMVQPLDDLMAGVDMAALGYTSEALALTQVDGVQYALPWTSSTPVMFFNAELVKQAGGDPGNMPATRDDTIALAADIDALGPDIMGMYYAPGDDDWMVQNLLATAGMQPVADDGTLAFGTDRGREALGLLERFHDEGGQEGIPNAAARQQVYAGGLGLYFNSTAAVRSFETEIGDRFAWGTAQMPTLVEGGGVASGGMAAVVLTDDPATRAAAFAYLLYGTGAEGQACVVENTGYMPVNTGAMADDRLGAFYASHPAWRTSADQMDRAFSWFAWPGQNGVRISQTVVDALAAIANDQATAAEAADGLSADIGRLMR